MCDPDLLFHACGYGMADVADSRCDAWADVLVVCSVCVCVCVCVALCLSEPIRLVSIEIASHYEQIMVQISDTAPVSR